MPNAMGHRAAERQARADQLDQQPALLGVGIEPDEPAVNTNGPVISRPSTMIAIMNGYALSCGQSFASMLRTRSTSSLVEKGLVM
jgi:hypothetical protein